MSFTIELINKYLKKIGYEIHPAGLIEETSFVRRIPYASDEEKRIMDICKPFTQTTPETLFSLIRATKHISVNKIEGAFVECGVWKGGSIMAMALTLDFLNELRNIFLFDTFEGMPSGSDLDIDLDGNDEKWYRKESDKYVHAGKGDDWNRITIDDVKNNLSKIHVKNQSLNFIKGIVEETLPSQAPEKIALLRLDTDFYSSTKHELETLFPKLNNGGIIIIDDYGHFLGARKAVDEYFEKYNIKILMHRIDYTAIIGIKQNYKNNLTNTLRMI